MRRSCLPFLIAMMLVVWPGHLAAQTDSPILPSPQVTELPVSFVSGTFGLWSGDAFVFVEHRFSGAPVIKIFGRDGKQVSQMTLSIPEAGQINLYDRSVARGPDGTLAVIGSTAAESSTFLALLSADGHQQTIVRLSPFMPSAVTVGADGTIWVAGHLRPTGPEQDHNQPLIRRYDWAGKLVGSLVPWSSLGEIAPRTASPDIRSVLLSSPTAIGWYSPQARTYIEFSLDATEVYRVQTPEHPREETLGAALCDDGRVFVSASLNASRNRAASWGIYALDRARGKWNFTAQSGSWGAVYGCDGARIASTVNQRTITWLELAAN